MKGVVFTEFLDFVGSIYGDDMVDDIVEDACLPHGGAYTAVGTYPFVEMQRLTTALTLRAQIQFGDLMRGFGDHLCRRFIVKYPQMFDSQPNLFDFIESVDRYIHVEVHKLYADAELPKFRTHARDTASLTIDYKSCRPLEMLAEGMIRAAADHFGEVVTVDRARVLVEEDSAVRFTIRTAA